MGVEMLVQGLQVFVFLGDDFLDRVLALLELGRQFGMQARD